MSFLYATSLSCNPRFHPSLAHRACPLECRFPGRFGVLQGAPGSRGSPAHLWPRWRAGPEGMGPCPLLRRPSSYLAVRVPWALLENWGADVSLCHEQVSPQPGCLPTSILETGASGGHPSWAFTSPVSVGGNLNRERESRERTRLAF